jgi:putative colanic acid biosynthesis UDP-glucose lipid carrier transferase
MGRVITSHSVPEPTKLETLSADVGEPIAIGDPTADTAEHSGTHSASPLSGPRFSQIEQLEAREPGEGRTATISDQPPATVPRPSVGSSPRISTVPSPRASGAIQPGLQAGRTTDDPLLDSPSRYSRDYTALPFRIAGSRGSAASLPDARENVDSIRPVAHILAGAAYASGAPSEAEQRTVRGLLCQLLGTDTLPLELERELADFDPARFDLRQEVEALKEQSNTTEQRLIQLVRKVCDADATIDLSEDNYMVGLALALSLRPSSTGRIMVAESSGVHGALKRFEDLVLGSIMLAILAVPMLIIGLLVRVTSPGPALFKQRRYGRGGTEINVLKFRTMRVQENGATVTQAKAGDARITPLGAFLRRSSLDELPQLINVVQGSMSLVGPRPHAVAHNEMYRRQIVEYHLRHKVKPGITGWAQVNGWRGETDTLRKMVYRVEHDLDYIREWSLWFDVKILFLTVFGRKVRRNAY